MWFTCPKEKIEKKYFSLQKLPKLQSTRFWSQGILGVKLFPQQNQQVYEMHDFPIHQQSNFPIVPHAW
jgi:hypothetical protein